AGAVLVGDLDADGLAGKPVGVGVHGAAQRAGGVQVVDGVAAAIAPVDVDRPRAVGAWIAEAAQAEGVVLALIGALVDGCRDRGRHVVDHHDRGVLGVAAVLVDDAGPHGVAGRGRGGVVGVGAGGAGAGARAGVGGRGQRAVVAGVGVVEA